MLETYTIYFMQSSMSVINLDPEFLQCELKIYPSVICLKSLRLLKYLRRDWGRKNPIHNFSFSNLTTTFLYTHLYIIYAGKNGVNTFTGGLAELLLNNSTRIVFNYLVYWSYMTIIHAILTFGSAYTHTQTHLHLLLMHFATHLCFVPRMTAQLFVTASSAFFMKHRSTLVLQNN